MKTTACTKAMHVQNTVSFNHEPVLLQEAISSLALENGMTVVDATMGGGGHSVAMIEKILPAGKFIGIDQDTQAIEAATTNISSKFSCHTNQFIFHNKNFRDIDDALDGTNVDAILADIGVSSHQIDTPERGFSYMVDAPLDMRMNDNSRKKAIHLVNELSEKQLSDLIFNYGEERYSRQIARNIVSARPIPNSTLALAEICVNSVPSSYFKSGGHPAKRTFQALRIAINDELGALEDFIPKAIDALKPNGRLAIISFHSLEDRIVKQAFKRLESKCLCPPKSPQCICNHRPSIKVITKKPIVPSIDEVKRNPRSSSAKLRIAQKLA